MTQVEVPKRIKSRLSGVKIVIDLTPLLPGGENGGAKWMTLELVNSLAGLLPETLLVLLTAEASHSELGPLESEHANIQRMCVLRNRPQAVASAVIAVSAATQPDRISDQRKPLAGNRLPASPKQAIKAVPGALSTMGKRAFDRFRSFAARVLPTALGLHVKYWLRRLNLAANSESMLRQIGADLLFCPFTAPFYADPLIPTVSVIYDLQYRAYPQFFTPEERTEREKNFWVAAGKARYLVAISEFVRKTVIESASVPPDHVVAVPIGLLRTPGHPADETSGSKLLEKYGLRGREYILYPANFWQHKNHAMLLTAFNLYRRANPASKLKLLCTGSPGRGSEAFCEAVRRMGLEGWVVYPGYVTSDEYDFLLSSAFAMVFPSLYEGFGIPVLEAMSAGVPVLCSDVTSLPEVGGEAVLYFDPRRPGQIVDTLRRLSEEPGLRESQVRKGVERALQLRGVDHMALKYADVFVKALFPG